MQGSSRAIMQTPYLERPAISYSMMQDKHKKVVCRAHVYQQCSEQTVCQSNGAAGICSSR